MRYINAGKYNKRISIFETTVVKDSAGFQHKEEKLVLQTYANVKTTKGMTLIKITLILKRHIPISQSGNRL